MHGLTQPAIASRFVEELPPEHIERAETQLSAMSGLGGGFGSGFGANIETGTDPVTATYGPGYARMLAGRRRMTDVTPRHGHAGRQTAPAAGIEPGVRVFHQKFGYGRVRAIDGDRLDVDFEKAGQKKVIATFVKPA
jgi:DNA helicase-2/ATP-dependent DNA helicase PcrA